MIYNKDVLFLHYPKTAGMMLTRELLLKLKGRVHYALPKDHASPYEKLFSLTGKVIIADGARHESLRGAKIFLSKHNTDRSLESFKQIFFIIRNPYDFTVSRYHYLKENLHLHHGPISKIIKSGSFEDYVLDAPNLYPIEHYFFLEGKSIPSNLKSYKFENLKEELQIGLRPFLWRPLNFGRKVNVSYHDSYPTYINTAEMEQAIYQKFKFLFDNGFYKRMVL